MLFRSLNNTVADIDDGYIESTATKVINHNLLLFFVIQTVGKCRCCRLIDYTLYIKPCNLTCIFCSLSLCIIEVSRNGNNRLSYLLTKIREEPTPSDVGSSMPKLRTTLLAEGEAHEALDPNGVIAGVAGPLRKLKDSQ